MSVLDLIFVIVALLVVSVAALFSNVLITDFQEQTQDVLTNRSNNITATGVAVVENFDYAILFLFGGVIVALIISAFLIPTHPVFFVISLLVFIMVLLIVPQISNLFEAISEEDKMSDAVTDYTMTQSLWDNMPIIILCVGAILFIVMYSKRGDNVRV